MLRFPSLLCLALALAIPSARADEKNDSQDKAIRALAKRIDHLIEKQWKAENVQPAPKADDAEFARRVYLDLAGRIPSVGELREFLNDKRPDRRERLVKKLLQSSRYVTHFVTVWRKWLIPETNQSLQARFLVGGFNDWIREKLLNATAYDKMVREILTLPINGSGPTRARIPYANGDKPTPIAFYLAKETKPENLAAATSRLFLGVRLECAQCHDHPFATWEQKQFWQYAAFFSGLRPTRGAFATPSAERKNSRSIAIPDTDKVAQATFLDGGQPKWKDEDSSRDVLANWMTSKENPYFARAFTNRMWSYFFGRGIIEPMDEMVGSEAEASHPEVLKAIATGFRDNGFDVQFLIRVITSTRAYQLSSRSARDSLSDPALFARMPLRGLSGEQLYDSIVEATGYRGPTSQRGRFARPGSSLRDQFLQKFTMREGDPDAQTSILQALTLMNGGIVTDATSLSRSETLTAITDNPFMDLDEQIEVLYLSTLSRRPDPTELKRIQAHVASFSKGEEDKGTRRNEALADVFWVLLNSSEFMFNH